MTVYLLACDGGGIRGYITASIIKALNDATNGKLLKKVNGFAGTSTGGIISTALAVNVPIETLVDIYQNEAKKIFQKNSWLSDAQMKEAEAAARTTGDPTLEGIFSGPGYTRCQYVADGLKGVISDHVHQNKLSDISADRFLAINTCQLWQEQTIDSKTIHRWAPVTLNNKGVGAVSGDLSLVDVALATSAAPSYFPPHDIANVGFFADGGIFANDPVMNGVEVALSSGTASTQSDIEVISIGTGLVPTGINPSEMSDPLDWGMLRWAGLVPWTDVPSMALVNMMFDLSAANGGTVSKQILGDQMVRVTPLLDKAVALDDYSTQAYKIMNAAITNATKSDAFCAAVTKVNNWP